MLSAAYALLVTSLLLPAQPDTSALAFAGFRAGVALDDLRLQLRSLASGPLRCRTSRTDRRVTECRAIITDPDLGDTVELWVSAINGLAGVLTLSGPVTSDQLDRWRDALETRYGRVEIRRQGPQRMLQWVRRGRMIRLTWRQEALGRTASVSLVDGRVLDDWGRARARAATDRTVAESSGTQPSSRTR